jgi:hypothetical protein
MPGEPVRGPAPGSGRGQHWLVVAGSARRGTMTLGPLSCAFVHPDEQSFEACGGPDGAILLAMQFPRRAVSVADVGQSGQ